MKLTTNAERLTDLVRYKRHDLYREGLISDDEYAELVQVQGAVARLESYDELRARMQRLEQWVADLQSGMFVNCVYCGHRYGPRNTTPVAMADVLKEHVQACPEHPMAKLRKATEFARQALRYLDGFFKGLEDSTAPEDVALREIRQRVHERPRQWIAIALESIKRVLPEEKA